jgi:hemolysin III
LAVLFLTLAGAGPAGRTQFPRLANDLRHLGDYVRRTKDLRTPRNCVSRTNEKRRRAGRIVRPAVHANTGVAAPAESSMASVTTNPSAIVEAACAAADPQPVNRRSEEWSNTLTHGIGTILSMVAAMHLVDVLKPIADPGVVLGCGVYAATLVAVYVCSTLSHFFDRPGLKRAFRILDQAFIYLLIVGTYTPVAAIYLHGGWLTALLVAMWCVALTGFVSKAFLRHRIDCISTVAYVVLGWMPILAVREAWLLVPRGPLVLFFCGGLCYTLGVIFLLLDRRVPYFHTAWHLMVMAGSALHFLAVVQCVASVAHAAAPI